MGPSEELVPFRTRQEIEQKAAELAERATGSTRVLNAVEIARGLGIPVHPTDFVDPDVAGMLIRKGELVEIFVRLKDPSARQNFTVAHELGHLALDHPGAWTDNTNAMYRRSAWSDEKAGRRAEYQANLFAAALLMPEREMRERWKLFRSINYLVPQFPVSRKAIRRRLEDLGLIISTPKSVSFVDISGWVPEISTPQLLEISDSKGPIPIFPPLSTDEQGRIIALSEEEWAARSSALDRVFKIAGSRKD